ncbi:MAG TPA: Calx-beta domain-containing protein [Kiritimatiellia bacterium]|nr:Calx-beta domain-containing protein [Kiritimatiellia bacterium]
MSILSNLLRPACVAAACMVLAGGLSRAEAQTFSEPATIFYGKVIGTGSAQPFMINEGALQWTIQRSDGVEVTLTTSLFAFQGGELSYRLEVPHSAMALGLTQTGGVPLPPVPQTHVHKLVTVDGETAALLGPASSAFTSEQLLRTATYRMDLALGRAAVDTDGDGMADWWEDKHGLDKQNPNDANTDRSGDGLTALQAYLQGLDPNHDYRNPELLTGELVVYPAGATAVLLDVKDLNSGPSNLVFTLTGLPAAGALTLRNTMANPANPDTVLEVGAQFTQAELFRGRLVYTHDGSLAQPGFFTVELRDETASAISTGTVQLLAYEPADLLPAELPALEVQRLDNHLFASAGYVIADGGSISTNVSLAAPSAGLDAAGLASHLASYGAERQYVFADGAGHDTVRGGAGDDVLFIGAGNDLLAGGPGADRFVFKSFVGGLKTIEDFSLADLDVLDLSRLTVTPGAFVHHYLRFSPTAGVQRLQVDLDGDGVGFTNLAVRLPGLSAADADLYSLIESGRLLVAGLKLEPMITVAATTAQASENGPAPGIFTLTRRGSLDGDLVVNIAMSGAAQNGVDYALVPGTVTFPEGQAAVTVTITPFADSITEPAETVQLVVQPGSGYRVGAADRATLTIEDLLMLVEIEVLEPVAVKDTLTPATFLITRRDVVNVDVLVRLKIAGTAANGTDYNTIATTLYMPAWQTMAMVQVTPKAGANLAGGMETVVLSINTSASYRVSGSATAQVAIIERIDSFDAWRTREAGGEGGLADFAQAAPGESGIPNLERYAFGAGASATDLSGMPQPFLHDGRLGVTFKKPLSVSDVAYRVSAATDLLNTTGSQVPLVEMPALNAQQDPQRVFYVVDPAAGEVQAIFTIVEVEWTP